MLEGLIFSKNSELLSFTYLNGMATFDRPNYSPPATMADVGISIALSSALAKELEKSESPFLVPATNPSSNGLKIKLKVPLSRFVITEKASKLDKAFPVILILEPKLY